MHNVISCDRIFLLVSKYLSLWFWPSLELAIFVHRHFLFHILQGFPRDMLLRWDWKSFLCPGKFIIVHSMKKSVLNGFLFHYYCIFLFISDVNFQNKGTHWTPLHAATFQEHGPVSLFSTHLCPNAIFFSLKSGLFSC